jgi:hypothetical protein
MEDVVSTTTTASATEREGSSGPTRSASGESQHAVSVVPPLPISASTMSVASNASSSAPALHHATPAQLLAVGAMPSTNGGTFDAPGNTVPKKVFCGGLPMNCTDQQLRTFAEQFGEVAEAIVLRDRNTKAPRGFGFATFKDAACYEMCLKAKHLHQMGDKKIEIKETLIDCSKDKGADASFFCNMSGGELFLK